MNPQEFQLLLQRIQAGENIDLLDKGLSAEQMQEISGVRAMRGYDNIFAQSNLSPVNTGTDNSLNIGTPQLNLPNYNSTPYQPFSGYKAPMGDNIYGEQTNTNATTNNTTTDQDKYGAARDIFAANRNLVNNLGGGPFSSGNALPGFLEINHWANTQEKMSDNDKKVFKGLNTANFAMDSGRELISDAALVGGIMGQQKTNNYHLKREGENKRLMAISDQRKGEFDTLADNYMKKVGPVLAQNGGEYKMAKHIASEDLLTAPKGEGFNAYLENGEYYLGNQGNAQKVVGDNHEDPSKGVRVEMEEGGRVVSRNVILSDSDKKRYKEEYGLNIGKKETYASLIEKYDKDLGIPKLDEEQAKFIEKLEKSESELKDDNTKNRNKEYLSGKINELEQKKEATKDLRLTFFNEVYASQTAEKENGDFDTKRPPIEGTEPLAQNGGTMLRISADKSIPVFQEGGEYFTDSEDNNALFQEYIKSKGFTNMEQVFQQGGEMQQQQEMLQMVAQALQEGAEPQQVLQSLVEQGIPQEQATQLIQGVIQQLQQAPQQQEVPQYQMGNMPYIPREGFINSGEFIGPQLPSTEVPNVTPQQIYAEKDLPKTAVKVENGKVPEGTKKGTPVYQKQGNGYVLVDPFTLYGENAIGSTAATAKELELIQSKNVDGSFGKTALPLSTFMDKNPEYFTPEMRKNWEGIGKLPEGKRKELWKGFQTDFNPRLKTRLIENGYSETEADKIVKEVGFSGDKEKGIDGKGGGYSTTRVLPKYTGKTDTPELPDIIDYKEKEVDETVAEDLPVFNNNSNKFSPYKDRSFINYIPDTPSPLRLPSFNLETAQTVGPLKVSEEKAAREIYKQSQANLAAIQGNIGAQQGANLAANNSQTYQAINDAITQRNITNAQLADGANKFNAGAIMNTDRANIGSMNAYSKEVNQAFDNTNRDIAAWHENTLYTLPKGQRAEERALNTIDSYNPNITFDNQGNVMYDPNSGQPLTATNPLLYGGTNKVSAAQAKALQDAAEKKAILAHNKKFGTNYAA